MIKIILFDCDGLIIKHNKYFSQRLEEERGIVVDTKDQKSFFSNAFLLCEAGKADLKIEMSKRLATWGWQGTIEDLMRFWFEGEAEVDLLVKDYILKLRAKGLKCFLSTNNEKYRVEYLWQQAGLKDFLDGKLSSAELGHLKPELGFWEEAYKRIPQVNKDEILVWDDAESAIASAKQFGVCAEFYSDFKKFKEIMTGKYNL